jgi:hypothetical protein
MLGGTADSFGSVISGASSSYELSVNLNVAFSTLTVPAIPVAQGTAPSPFSDGTFVAGYAASHPVIGSANTGLMTVNATSNIDGLAGSRSAAADATVHDLLLNIVPGLPTTLHATATTVASTANVSGDFGSLAALGTTTLENLSLSVLGVTIPVTSNPAPNTEVFNTGWILIVLNEEIPGGNGTSSRSLAVNAIHINFTNAPIATGLLNGDIFVSHSQSSLTATPEPATAGLLLVAALMGRMRRRRR